MELQQWAPLCEARPFSSRVVPVILMVSDFSHDEARGLIVRFAKGVSVVPNNGTRHRILLKAANDINLPFKNKKGCQWQPLCVGLA